MAHIPTTFSAYVRLVSLPTLKVRLAAAFVRVLEYFLKLLLTITRRYFEVLKMGCLVHHPPAISMVCESTEVREKCIQPTSTSDFLSSSTFACSPQHPSCCTPLIETRQPPGFLMLVHVLLVHLTGMDYLSWKLILRSTRLWSVSTVKLVSVGFTSFVYLDTISYYRFKLPPGTAPDQHLAASLRRATTWDLPITYLPPVNGVLVCITGQVENFKEQATLSVHTADDALIVFLAYPHVIRLYTELLEQLQIQLLCTAKYVVSCKNFGAKEVVEQLHLQWEYKIKTENARGASMSIYPAGSCEEDGFIVDCGYRNGIFVSILWRVAGLERPLKGKAYEDDQQHIEALTEIFLEMLKRIDRPAGDVCNGLPWVFIDILKTSLPWRAREQFIRLKHHYIPDPYEELLASSKWLAR